MDNNKTTIAYLIREHGWRVTLIFSFLIISAQKIQVVKLDTSFSIWYIALSLVIANWLRIEMNTIKLRMYLPRGELGYLFVGDILPFFKPLESCMRKTKKYGDYFFTNFTMGQMVVFGNNDGINWLWNAERKQQLQATYPSYMVSLLGNNSLLQLSGKRHRALRRLFEPAFTPVATKDYISAIDQLVSKCLKEWSQDDTFHSSTVFKTFALKAFFTAALGSIPNQDFLDQMNSDYISWTSGFVSLFHYRIPGVPTGFSKAMDSRERILRAIEDLVTTFKKENPQSSPNAQNSMMGRICWASDENGKLMEMEDLKDNILLMIFAGHDTTYCSIGSALHYLHKFPDIQQALRNEVMEFQEPLDFHELKNAPILNAFMTECWRIVPPVEGSPRMISQPLEYKGFNFPKGFKLSYNAIIATKNEEIYKEPSQFSIGRFLPKDHPLFVNNDSNIHVAEPDSLSKGTFPVFGGGVHGCLGSNFAKLEIRCLITRILQGYDLDVKKSTRFSIPFHGWKNEFKLLRKN